MDEYLLPLFFKIQNQINEIKAHKLTIEPFFESIKNWVMEIQAGSLDFSSEKPRLPAWISYSSIIRLIARGQGGLHLLSCRKILRRYREQRL